MITRSSLLLIALGLSITSNVQAQSKGSTTQATRPRTVTATTTPATKSEPQSTQRTTASRASQPIDKKVANHIQQDEAKTVAKDESNRRLTPNRLRLKISEAQRLLKAGPVPTAMTPSLEFVTIAALLPETSQIHLIKLAKQTFLTKGT